MMLFDLGIPSYRTVIWTCSLQFVFPNTWSTSSNIVVFILRCISGWLWCSVCVNVFLVLCFNIPFHCVSVKCFCVFCMGHAGWSMMNEWINQSMDEYFVFFLYLFTLSVSRCIVLCSRSVLWCSPLKMTPKPRSLNCRYSCLPVVIYLGSFTLSIADIIQPTYTISTWVQGLTFNVVYVLNSGYIWNKTETKLKQNNFTETKHCFTFVLFEFYFSFILDVTTALHS